jgi:hypothetical protein
MQPQQTANPSQHINPSHTKSGDKVGDRRGREEKREEGVDVGKEEDREKKTDTQVTGVPVVSSDQGRTSPNLAMRPA